MEFSGPTPRGHDDAEHEHGHEVRPALEDEEGDGVAGDLLAGIPPLRSAQAPSASPPAPDAGTSEPAPELGHPELVVVRHVIREQNTGLNMRM